MLLYSCRLRRIIGSKMSWGFMNSGSSSPLRISRAIARRGLIQPFQRRFTIHSPIKLVRSVSLPALDGTSTINLTLLFRSSGAIIVNSCPLLPSTSSTILALFNNRKHHRQRDIAKRHEGLRRQGHEMCPDGSRSLLQLEPNGAAYLVRRNANCLSLHVDAKRVEGDGTTPWTQPLVDSNFLSRAFSRALHKVAIWGDWNGFRGFPWHVSQKSSESQSRRIAINPSKLTTFFRLFIPSQLILANSSGRNSESAFPVSIWHDFPSHSELRHLVEARKRCKLRRQPLWLMTKL